MKISENAAMVLGRLEQAGYSARLVGGCVRDRYMGVPPHDYDVATSARPAQVQALFADLPVIETGLKHGTVTIVAGGEPIEVTTYREETGYSDHRHPDAVRFTDQIEADLARRDFTMNAIAADLRGAYTDPFGGRADIDRRLIRCVGDPLRRFEEDALRILRAMRFAARLGFSIEPATADAMLQKKETLRAIAAERIYHEWIGLLQGAYAGAVLRDYAQVARVFMPELAPPDHAFEALAQAPADPAARWALLFAGRPDALRLALERLKAPRAVCGRAEALACELGRSCPAERVEVHRSMIRLGADLAETALALRAALGQPGAEAAVWAKELRRQGACFSVRDLAVSGRDLIACGYSGASVGAALERLLQLAVEEQLPNDKVLLLQRVQSL